MTDDFASDPSMNEVSNWWLTQYFMLWIGLVWIGIGHVLIFYLHTSLSGRQATARQTWIRFRVPPMPNSSQ